MAPPNELIQDLGPEPDRGRFAAALGVALALHLVIILGLDFVPGTERPSPPATLDVVYVPSPTETDVTDAEQYAQADSDGEPRQDEPRPQVHADTLAREGEPDPAAEAAPEGAPEPAPQVHDEPLTDSAPEIAAQEHDLPEMVEPVPEQVRSQALERPESPSATQLIQSGLASARQPPERGREQVRRTYITSRTQEHVYASYMETWRRKVEQVGNMNYPEAARKENLYGNLILDVAINADGSVREINLRRSSGHPALDEAAKRIVRLAAPFAAFPEQIREETDVLHITRTWQFRRDNQLQGR